MEQYIQPFIDVCQKIFLNLCKAEVNAGRAYFVQKDDYEKYWDISGIIGLSGEVSGAVAISMKDVTACQITEILTRKKHDTVDNKVTDAVGEIINIISGNVKKHFEDKLRIKISLPSIIKGKTHAIVWPSKKTRIICIPFSIFSDQEICLSIAVESLK